MKLLIRSSVFFLFISIVSCSQSSKETQIEKFKIASPEDVGMISDSLAKIESMVEEFVNAGKYPGAVTLIAKDGKIIYESDYDCGNDPSQ